MKTPDSLRTDSKRSARRTGLFAFATFVAVSAYGGAIGLATGALDMEAKINHRLPLHSPVFGAVALALNVGLPATAVAVLARRGDRRCGPAAITAGVLLIGWIVVEIAFIRELAFLQVFYFGAGVAFVVAGRYQVSMFGRLLPVR